MLNQVVRRSTLTLLVAVGLAPWATAQPAAPEFRSGPPTDSQNPLEATGAFLWNITSQPLHYRLRLTKGLTWSDQRVLGPGEKLDFAQESAGTYLGTGPTTSPRYLVIEYYTMQGLMSNRLSSRSLTNPDMLLPYYFAVEDADGVIWLVQTADRARAEALQAEYRGAAKLTPEQLAGRRRHFRMAGLWRPLVPEMVDGQFLPTVYGWPTGYACPCR